MGDIDQGNGSISIARIGKYQQGGTITPIQIPAIQSVSTTTGGK